MRNEKVMGFTINSGNCDWVYPHVGDLPDDYSWPTAPLQQGIPSSITWTISGDMSKPPKREDYALAELGHLKGEPRLIIGVVSRETLDAVAKFSVLRSDAKAGFIEWRYGVRVYERGSEVAFYPGYSLVIRQGDRFKVVSHKGETCYGELFTYGAEV